VNFSRIEAIADAILYEGYLLYPYRPTALKNRHRWTFGVLPPEVGPDAAPGLQCACLVLGDVATEVDGKVRFLRPVPTENGPDAAPGEVDVGPTTLGALSDAPRRFPFVCGDAHPIEGLVELGAAPAGVGAYRLTLHVRNLTPVPTEQPGDLSAWSMASTQVALGVRRGEFVPPRDPPASLRPAAEACHNVGLWPILVGEPGTRDLLLCSPIILDDYARIAPESPGDLFDGTEIDELLTLRILTLTPEEKRQMAAAGERAARLLERAEELEPDRLGRLHGAWRSTPGAEREVRVGDRVRLRPRGRADIIDLALDGRAATIEKLERDVDGRRYVVVTVDDDPGRDLGAPGQPGHRFFFAPEEVELLRPAEDAP
jgi:hypothetical protein